MGENKCWWKEGRMMDSGPSAVVDASLSPREETNRWLQCVTTQNKQILLHQKKLLLGAAGNR